MYSEKKKLHEREKLWRPGQLRTIALDITPKCNMNCPHCYNAPFSKVEPVPLPALERMLQEAYEMGLSHYVIQGGEPLEDPERLEAVLGYLHPEEAYITITSNGWSMTREQIRWLKKLQVDKIAFSLDSGFPEEHDRGRRPGSFQRVLVAIDQVLEEGLLSAISSFASHESLYSESFRRVFQIALERGIRLELQMAQPVGRLAGRTDLAYTPEDMKYIKDLMYSSPRLPNGQLPIKRDLFTNDPLVDRCPAGREYLNVTADGHVMPCNYIQYTLGNIRDRSIRDMREDLLASPWFRDPQEFCLSAQHQEFVNRFTLPNASRPVPQDAYEAFNLPRRAP